MAAIGMAGKSLYRCGTGHSSDLTTSGKEHIIRDRKGAAGRRLPFKNVWLRNSRSFLQDGAVISFCSVSIAHFIAHTISCFERCCVLAAVGMAGKSLYRCGTGHSSNLTTSGKKHIIRDRKGAAGRRLPFKNVWLRNNRSFLQDGAVISFCSVSIAHFIAHTLSCFERCCVLAAIGMAGKSLYRCGTGHSSDLTVPGKGHIIRDRKGAADRWLPLEETVKE